MTYDERYFILGVCAVAILLSPLCRGGAAEASTMDLPQKECQTLMKEVQRSVQNSKTLGDALGNIDDQDEMKKLLLCQVTEREAEKEAERKAKREAEKKAERKAKYLKRPFTSFLLGDLRLKANAGYTETVGSNRLRRRVRILGKRGEESGRLDNRQEAYGVEVGYFGKPVLRDFFFLFRNEDIEKHRKAIKKAEKTGKGNRSSRILDAVKFDLSFGFGRSIIDNLAGQQTLETYNKTFFTVGMHYSIPLRQLFPFLDLPPPLPE